MKEAACVILRHGCALHKSLCVLYVCAAPQFLSFLAVVWAWSDSTAVSCSHTMAVGTPDMFKDELTCHMHHVAHTCRNPPTMKPSGCRRTWRCWSC